ncbi:MAG: acyltransferase family protein [Janthinobacterium lividum]
MSLSTLQPVSKPETASAGSDPLYLTLDAWRGIAGLSVVGFHATKGVLNRFPEMENHLGCTAGLWGWLGVQLFFVVSGYCITGAAVSNLRRSAFPFRAFVLARFRRIYPTCWFALLGTATFMLAAAKMASKGYLRDDIFTQIGFFQHSVLFYVSNLTLTQLLLHQPLLLDVTWSLCYEVAFYFIAASVLLLTLNWVKKERNFLNALHGLTVACLTLLIIVPSRCGDPFDLWPQFGMGVLAFDWISYSHQKSSRGWAAVIGVQMLVLSGIDHGTLGAMQQPARASCLVCLVFAILLVVLYRWDLALSQLRPIKWLSGIGMFSYSLYLTHTLTLRAVNQVARLIHLSDPPIVFAIGIVISLIAARIFYQCFERPFISARKH